LTPFLMFSKHHSTSYFSFPGATNTTVESGDMLCFYLNSALIELMDFSKSVAKCFLLM
jgi:hypothetical protein